MRLITRLLLVAFVLLLVAEFIPGIRVDGFYPALIAAVIMGLLNLFVKPIIFILTLPINILTLGLFTFVINASLFWFAGTFIKGFSVENFWSALAGSIIVSLASALASKFISKE
jgi:putative membrane protein